MREPKKPSKGKSGFKMLVFGFPGVGKTRFIGTQPNTLIIRPPTDQTGSIENPDNVREVVVRDWQDMWEVQEWGQQGGFETFDWVWLDSISLWQDYGLDDVFADAIARKSTRKEFGPDVGEYGINMTRIGKWVRDMYGLADAGKFNFGVTAHPFEFADPSTDELVLGPFIQGRNMPEKICGYMNLVAYMQTVHVKGKRKSYLLSEAEGFYGKDQFHIMPQMKSGKRGLVEPTMDKLTKIIPNSGKKKSNRKKKGK